MAPVPAGQRKIRNDQVRRLTLEGGDEALAILRVDEFASYSAASQHGRNQFLVEEVILEMDNPHPPRRRRR
jgi:hypothetical protein